MAGKIRIIRDIPTSKIRSVVTGLAEVCGRALQKYRMESRIIKLPCVYCRFLIEVESRDSRGHKHWRKIDGGDTTNYFYVEDDTGRILVDPLGAEIILPYDYRYVDYNGTAYAGRRVRYTEWRIEPGEEVYALGSAGKFQSHRPTRAGLLAAKIAELKNDRQRMKALDADGTVSPHEWDAAVRKFEEDSAAEDLSDAAASAADNDDIVIAAGVSEKTFIISDHSEKALCRRLAPGSYASVFVGFCIIIAALGSAPARAGFYGTVPAVPWVKIISLAGRVVL